MIQRGLVGACSGKGFQFKGHVLKTGLEERGSESCQRKLLILGRFGTDKPDGTSDGRGGNRLAKLRLST